LTPLPVGKTRSDVPHLFEFWDQISGRIRDADDIRLFLDFDGTLVPYCSAPEDVKLSGASGRALARLARHPRVHVVIVSGRRNAALRQYIRVPRIQFLGLFGWEKRGRPAIALRIRKALRLLRPDLALLPKSFPGVRVEDKGISYSIHFRGAAPDARRRVHLRIRPLLSRIRPDFRMIHSNHAIEIVPWEVRGKGVAIREYTRSLRTRFLPIYIGDDSTDEPAFLALRRGITVCVGPFHRTSAQFRLKDPEEVRILLERLEKELS
jgi:trehalose 6-phosphate phosphatase